MGEEMASTRRQASNAVADVAGEQKAAPKRRKRKSADGEGLLRQRKDGMWEGRLMVGVRADGKPDMRSVYGKTQSDTLEKLDKLRQRYRTGTLGQAKAERQTIGVFMTDWLAATQASVRPLTWRRYEQLVRIHISPTLGRHRLSALRPEHVQAFYAQKLAEGLKPRTVQQMHAVLHHALKQAVRWGHVPRNVVNVVESPRVPRRELKPPTPQELERLLNSAANSDDPLVALWTVALYSGCRQGELLGLTWSDLDFETCTLSVKRSLTGATGGVPRFGEPKTDRSRRTLTLPSEALQVLRQHRERQAADRQALGDSFASYDLVFCTRLGTPFLARNITRSFKRALGRAGLSEAVRFHDLRHAAATTLRRAGVDLKTVSERLGHSKIGITADLYTHAVPALDADAAERLQRAIRGDKE